MLDLKISMLIASMDGFIKDSSFEFLGWKNHVMLYAKPNHPNTWISIQWTIGSERIRIECHRMVHIKDNKYFYMDIYSHRKRMGDNNVTVFAKDISIHRIEDVNEKVAEWISDVYDQVANRIETYADPIYLKLPESYGEPIFIHIGQAVHPTHFKDATKIITGDLLLRPILDSLTQGESN